MLMIVCVLSDLNDYPSLVEGESHGILLVFRMAFDIKLIFCACAYISSTLYIVVSFRFSMLTVDRCQNTFCGSYR